MKRLALLAVLIFASFSSAQEAKGKPVKHSVAPPIHAAKGVVSSAYSEDHLKFPRGLTPTPRHKLASAPRFSMQKAAPSQILMLPKKLDMWGNDQYGNCVSAQEAASKAAYSVYCGLPETFIPASTVISWARKYGYLNGANLPPVMDTMAVHGMTSDDGKVYNDGSYVSVDYSSEDQLKAAIAVGPVNLGLDANALPSGAGNDSAWYAFGGTPGSFNNEDHCCAFFGFGPTAELFKQVNAVYGTSVQPPSGAPVNAYLFYTWSTVGIVDHAWIMSTVGETWVRNPTTPGQGPPNPPVPPTPPTPPIGGTVTITLSQDMKAGTYVLPLDAPTPVPTKMNGTMTKNPDGSWTFTPTSSKEELKKTSWQSDIERRLDVNEKVAERTLSAVLDLQKVIIGNKAAADAKAAGEAWSVRREEYRERLRKTHYTIAQQAELLLAWDKSNRQPIAVAENK